jgi:hypothetical protein
MSWRPEAGVSMTIAGSSAVELGPSSARRTTGHRRAVAVRGEGSRVVHLGPLTDVSPTTFSLQAARCRCPVAHPIARASGYATSLASRSNPCDLWQTVPCTFSAADGVEPTNNHAERGLRGAVINRKLSLGSQSEQGERTIERLLSASVTCRLQGRLLFPSGFGHVPAVLPHAELGQAAEVGQPAQMGAAVGVSTSRTLEGLHSCICVAY